jgi:hypothetical protein
MNLRGILQVKPMDMENYINQEKKMIVVHE